jgi:hypothetical protein
VARPSVYAARITHVPAHIPLAYCAIGAISLCTGEIMGQADADRAGKMASVRAKLLADPWHTL